MPGAEGAADRAQFAPVVPAAAAIEALVEPERVVVRSLDGRIEGVADCDHTGGGIGEALQAIAALQQQPGRRRQRRAGGGIHRRNEAEARTQRQLGAGAAIEDAGGAAGALVAVGAGTQVLIEEQGDVGHAVAIDVARRQHLGAVGHREGVVAVGRIGEDFLGVGTQFDAHGGENRAGIDGDKIAVAIAVEITNRAQGSLGGGGQTIEQETGVAGELAELQVTD